MRDTMVISAAEKVPFLSTLMWRIGSTINDVSDSDTVSSEQAGELDGPLGEVISRIFARANAKRLPKNDLAAQLRDDVSAYLERAADDRAHETDALYAQLVEQFGGALIELDAAASELGFSGKDVSTIDGTMDTLDTVLLAFERTPQRVDEVSATRLHHVISRALHLAGPDVVVETYLRDRLAGLREHLCARGDAGGLAVAYLDRVTSSFAALTA